MHTKGKNLARVEQDWLLDEALEHTFPASDPVALQQASIIGTASKAVPTGKHAARKTNRPNISHGAERKCSYFPAQNTPFSD